MRIRSASKPSCAICAMGIRILTSSTDNDGTNLVLGPKPQLEGKNLIGIEDKKVRSWSGPD